MIFTSPCADDRCFSTFLGLGLSWGTIIHTTHPYDVYECHMFGAWYIKKQLAAGHNKQQFNISCVWFPVASNVSQPFFTVAMHMSFHKHSAICSPIWIFFIVNLFLSLNKYGWYTTYLTLSNNQSIKIVIQHRL